MAKEFNLNDLNALIEMLHLKPSYSLLDRDGKKVILETWQAKDNPFWKITRLIEFSKENLESLQPKARNKFLKSLLDEAVQKEEYEQAAELRDLMLAL